MGPLTLTLTLTLTLSLSLSLTPTLSKDDTVILDGAGGAAAVEERCEVTLGLGWLGLGVGVGVGGRAAVEERCEVLRDAIVDT